jgi:hypothetical protein
MKATVFGVVARAGTPVAIRSRSGRTVGAYAIDDYALELEDADIDLDHGGEPVGQVIYAEVSPENQLAVVGVVDGALAKIERPVFWSGSYMPDGDHGLRERSAVVPRAKILGLSLTPESANSSARAVSWMPGDVRSSTDRRQWPLGWKSQRPLLARALADNGLTESTRRIVDRREDAGSDYPWEKLRLRTWPSDAGLEHGRPIGPWRHGPRGRVIAVR